MPSQSILTTSIEHPNEFSLLSGSTNYISDLESIHQSIKLLLTTAKGELFGDPNFGCRLYSYLFEYEGEILFQMIKDDIVDTLTTQETRVEISPSDITITGEENGKRLNIKVLYTVRYTDYKDEYDLVITRRNEEEF